MSAAKSSAACSEEAGAMSRVGKYPVTIPAGVEVVIANNILTAKRQARPAHAVVDGSRRDDGRRRSCHGRSEVQGGAEPHDVGHHAVLSSRPWSSGVSTGFSKSMEVTGTGYRAAVQGKNLVINLGYSHDVVYPIPEGIKISLREADLDQGRGDGQAFGRSGCGRNPVEAAPGALQGQGREIHRRDHPSERR